MKRIIVAVLMIPMLLAGCGQQHDSPIPKNTFVYFQSIGHPAEHFTVTNETVTNVGQLISKTNLATNGPGSWTSSDNILAVYSIRGIDMSKEVTVKLNDGTYVMANVIPSSSSVQNPEFPSWLSFSSDDVSSITIKGWGPGAAGNFTIFPANGTSTSLINTLFDGLSNDKAIKPYRTPISQGGSEWIKLEMKNGTTISLVTFPNDPKPTQYIVTLDYNLQGSPKSTMISDISGKVTSVFHEIAKGKVVRQKTH